MNNYNYRVMKRICLALLISIVLGPSLLKAQNAGLEKLNNYKIAFFTRKLNLTSQEAEKFWPVYNEYQNQKNNLQLEKIRINRDFNQNGITMTDSEMEQLGDKYVDLLVQESNQAVAFHKKLKTVLSPAKVIIYYQAESQYKIQLLNELQTAKQQRQRLNRNF